MKKSTRIIVSSSSPVFQRLLSLTYDNIIAEEKSKDVEVRAILSSKTFWREKYKKDIGEPSSQIADWKEAYMWDILEKLPRYNQLLTLPYRELVRLEENPPNDMTVMILSTDNFWIKKYTKSFGEPNPKIINVRMAYDEMFNNKLIGTAINNIFGMLLNDIASARSNIYYKYNRSLSREVRLLGYNMGGCLGKARFNEEEYLSQAWLLDENNEKYKMMEREISYTFRHYNVPTAKASSPTDYYGAMYIGIINKDSTYYYNYPEVNEDLKYIIGYEPEEITNYIEGLMEEGVSKIAIYIFMSPEEGADKFNWIVKHEKEEVYLKGTSKELVIKYLDFILPQNTIYPIITDTLTNNFHTTKCGPWIV